jgi:hypothetical protein
MVRFQTEERHFFLHTNASRRTRAHTSSSLMNTEGTSQEVKQGEGKKTHPYDAEIINE